MLPQSRRIRPGVDQLEDRSVPATVQTFDGGGTGFVAHQHGVAPGPALVAGPTGNALRLASATVGTIGSITFGVSDKGTFPEVRAEFDLRMSPGSGRADGIGVAFLNTADGEYGTATFVGGFSEEPNYRKSLGVGFDIHKGPGDTSANTVSIHFNEQKLVDVDVPLGTLDLASGSFFHAKIIARFGTTASGGDVTVQLGPTGSETTVFNQVAVPGLLPYESRFHAMARSGGESADHDIDNITVQYIPPDPTPGKISFAAATHTVVESQQAIVLRAVRTGGSQGAVSVTATPANGSATAGADFIGGPFQITFAAGQTEKDISIPLVNDAVAEPAESMTVTLSNPTNGATLGAPTTATVTINDDDVVLSQGKWGEILPLPVTAIHTMMLPNGEVMLWSRHDAGQQGTPHIFNPATGVTRMVADPGYDIFCAGHVVLPDGRVFVAGGHKADGVGVNKASIYDWRTDTWTRLPDMNEGRWYPTVTLLPSGDVLVLGGTDQGYGDINQLPQVYEVGANKWRDLSTAKTDNFPVWADFYPWAAVAPDGRVFVAGPQQTARFLDTSGTGKWTDAGASELVYRDYGSAVEYSDGQMLITGGNMRGDPNALPSTSAQKIDMTAASPTFQNATPMTFGRRHHNLVLLPDGTVFAVGGSSLSGFQNLAGAVFTPEVWDPATNIWTPQAKHSIPLLYHSNALLLPTGQVLITGGGQPPPDGGVDQTNAQVFTPAYLLSNNPRPTIQSAPGATKYNVPFTLQTSNPAAIDKVMLIPLPSPTHAFNQNQGVSNLTFTRAATGLMVNAPADGIASAPGYYYLFAVSDKGVPSIAHIIQLDPNAPINTPPTISDIPNQGAAVGPIAFTIDDVETPVDSLVVTAISSNTMLVPNANITLSGSGTNRTITVTAAAGQTGTATITVTVTDGHRASATDTFDVVVNVPPPDGLPPLLVGGLPSGTAQVFTLTAGQFQPGPSPAFFSGSTVNVRTATGDVNGDGVDDYIGGTGVGKATQVVVIDGKTGGTIATIDPFESTFTGGVFVAVADINGDGKADVIVTPDKGGGPVVVLYSGAKLSTGQTNEAAQLLRYFGIDDPPFRGGARATAGDMNNDGVPEVIVSAGFLGGPRVTIWDGAELLNKTFKQLQNFFAFEDTLRKGAFLAAGDVTGDGKVDIAYGGGPGGAPRVRLFDGASQLAQGNIAYLDHIPGSQLANFFAGDSSVRGGIRLAFSNVDDDGKADLVTGSGEREPSRVRVYKGSELLANGADPALNQLIDPFNLTLDDGVFVG